MRPSFIVSLLLLSLFLTTAQGIRLDKGSFAVQQHKQNDDESTLLKKNNSDDEEAILCKGDQQCTGKIKNMKFATSVSTTHSISRNVKNEGNEAQPPVNGNTRNHKANGEEEGTKLNAFATSNHQEHYPDLVEIAEIDYSSVRRNPPIHN